MDLIVACMSLILFLDKQVRFLFSSSLHHANVLDLDLVLIVIMIMQVIILNHW